MLIPNTLKLAPLDDKLMVPPQNCLLEKVWPRSHVRVLTLIIATTCPCTDTIHCKHSSHTLHRFELTFSETAYKLLQHKHTHTDTHKHTHLYSNTHTGTHTHIQAHTHTGNHSLAHTHRLIHTLENTHWHTHTYTHTGTHTYKHTLLTRWWCREPVPGSTSDCRCVFLSLSSSAAMQWHTYLHDCMEDIEFGSAMQWHMYTHDCTSILNTFHTAIFVLNVSRHDIRQLHSNLVCSYQLASMAQILLLVQLSIYLIDICLEIPVGWAAKPGCRPLSSQLHWPLSFKWNWPLSFKWNWPLSSKLNWPLSFKWNWSLSFKWSWPLTGLCHPNWTKLSMPWVLLNWNVRAQQSKSL
jgi:hypothetical protein